MHDRINIIVKNYKAKIYDRNIHKSKPIIRGCLTPEGICQFQSDRWDVKQYYESLMLEAKIHEGLEL